MIAIPKEPIPAPSVPMRHLHALTYLLTALRASEASGVCEFVLTVKLNGDDAPTIRYAPLLGST